MLLRRYATLVPSVASHWSTLTSSISAATFALTTITQGFLLCRFFSFFSFWSDRRASIRGREPVAKPLRHWYPHHGIST
ncbi:unnamed protein product [Vitrella brassicaformis CCMP3155]|uniref:Uncharacterized protein n=1 Tax=Vitrella brassicaformis (strain CCMP3155) TaxID=1169540 RepID=A0A0G4ELR9_VITBC|nr:unnamed protein product [Vitrella brassicaformis CCMP3155]|eukprot:CEL98061.1 unnamed protein product [Vitrella brassicaformis CCMP3155]